MEHYPEATYEYFDPTFLENGTVEVSVAVTVEGITHTMWLPVMDNRNKSIVNATSRDLSDSRMRCLVKCVAMFGLGIYLYAGEDLPSSVKDAPVTGNQAAQLKALLEVTESDVQKFCQVFKCTSVDDLPAVQFDRALAMLNKKAQSENS